MASTQPKETQKEVTSQMDKACDVIDDKKSELNKRGREVAEEAKDVIQSAKMIIEHKRLAERIQNLIIEGRAAINKMYEEGKEIKEEVKQEAKKEMKEAPISKEEMKKEAMNALTATQNLILELLRSSRFRDTITDLLDVLYDIMVHRDAKDTNQQHLRHKSTYHGKRRRLENRQEQQFPKYDSGRFKLGQLNKPDYLTSSPMSSTTPLTSQMQTGYGTEHGSGPTATDMGKKASELGEKAAQKGAEMGGKAAEMGQKAAEAGKKVEEVAKDVDQKGVKGAAVAHGALTKEQADALEERLNNIMREISQRPRTQEATRSILNLIHLLRRGMEHIECKAESKEGDIKEKGKEVIDRMTDNKNMDKVAKICRDILESFTGKDSLSPLFDHLDALGEMAMNDPRINDLFRDLSNFLKRSLEDPTSLSDDSSHREEGRQLIKRLGDLDSLGKAGEGYRERLQAAFSEADSLIWKIREDPDIKRFTQSIDTMAKDLVLDKTGHMKIDAEGVKQLGKLVIEILNEELKFVPLPKLEVDLNENTHLEAENAIIHVPDLLPNQITVEAKASAEFGSTKLEAKAEKVKEKVTGKDEPASLVKSEINISIREMEVHIRNMEFHYTHTSFPKLDETGIAKIDVVGNGMSIFLKLSTNTGDDDIFKVEHLETDIDQLKIKVSGTSMDTFYNAVLKVFPGLIKSDLQKRVEISLEDLLMDLDHAIRDNLPSKEEIKETLQSAASTVKSTVDTASSKAKSSMDSAKAAIQEAKPEPKPISAAPER